MQKEADQHFVRAKLAVSSSQPVTASLTANKTCFCFPGDCCFWPDYDRPLGDFVFLSMFPVAVKAKT